MKKLQQLIGLLAALSLSSAASAVVITKAPDKGPYWSPLSGSSTYVYADSFVAPTSGAVSDLGFWFINGGSNFVLEILTDLGPGLGPNGAGVLGKTGVHSLTSASLTYVDYAPLTAINLIAGQTYWFAASTVGLGGTGNYQVGGHTQNTGGITDGGTFWYSNDPAGINFDGKANVVEMAFTVTIGPSAVPEPAPLLLLGAGLVGAVVARRRKARKA